MSSIDSDTDLDVSWIQNKERLQTIQNNYCREPMENIDAFFLYINQNKYIEKIISDKIPLSSNSISVLSKETILQIIQTHKHNTHSLGKYKLMDILLYNVDLEPENIQSYSKNENEQISESSSGFFKVIPIIDDIIIAKSIFIFHEINSIYFIFQEIDTGSKRHTIKSILKKNENEHIGSHKNTKKVRIQTANIIHSKESYSNTIVNKSLIPNSRKTRKHT